MSSVLLRVLLLPLLLAGCAGMQPAQPPDLVIADSHLFGVTQLAFAPSGKRIASGGFRGDVALWTVPEGGSLGYFQWHQDPVRGLLWIGPAYLVSASENGRLVVAGSGTGQVVGQRETVAGLTSLAYLESSKRLVAGYRDGRLRVFGYPGLAPAGEVDVGDPVVALASDRRGGRLALSTSDQRVLLMDATLSATRELTAPPRTALTLRFSPDGRQLAAGAWYDIFYWDLQSGALSVQDTEHWGAVTAIDFHPRRQQVVTIGRHTDASLRLAETADGRVIRRLQSHRLCGAAVRFSPDGRYVASGSDDESVRLYDLGKPYRPRPVREHW